MNAVIAFSLKHRVLMLVLFVMMLAGGIIAFRQLNIEAYPDPTPPMVDVVTQSPGLSAEEIERYITIPDRDTDRRAAQISRRSVPFRCTASPT